MLIKYHDKPVGPFVYNLLITVNLMFLFVLFVNMYRDIRYYKERVTNLKGYRNQANQFRRQKAEYDRQIAELSGDNICNPPKDLDNQ